MAVGKVVTVEAPMVWSRRGRSRRAAEEETRKMRGPENNGHCKGSGPLILLYGSKQVE
jgi:hypothetical protein